MRPLTLLILLSHLSLISLAQPTYFASRQSTNQGFIFYHWDGTPSFELAYGENPILTDANGQAAPSLLGSMTWIPATASDHLVIQTSTNWRMMDTQGKLLHEWPNIYQQVEPPSEGLSLAWQADSTRSNWKWGHYLNADGSPALSGQRFWQATAFSEGLALVQKERNSPWQIVDRQGKTLADLPAEISPYIQKVIPFQDGLAFVSTFMPVGYNRRQKKVRYFWINPQGEIALDPSEIVPAIGSVDFWIEPFKDGVASVRYRCGEYNCLAYFNPEGRILQSFAEAKAFSDWRQGQLYLHYRQGEEMKSQFFNTQGQPLPWPEVLDPSWGYVKTSGDYFVFRQAEAEATTFVVYDPVSNKLVLEGLRRQPFHAQADRFFFGAYRDNRLDSVLNKQGEVIFQPGPEIRVFESLAEALPYADRVQYLDLAAYKETDLSRLDQFKQLKNLKFYEYPFSELPAAVLANQSLEMLTLTGCSQLRSLPSRLARLEHLRELRLSNCRRLQGLETFIEQHGQLSRVFTENYDFQEGFEKRMKEEQPQLRIDSWHSFGDFDEAIEEAPAPVAAPAPARKN